MHIVTRKHLSEAIEKYPDAASEIAAWVGIVEAVRWHNFAEVRSMFKDADNVDDYVIFDIRHNRYRLVTVIHYAKTTKERQTEGHIYIRSFLTHKNMTIAVTGIGGLERDEKSFRKPGRNDRARRSARHPQ